MNQHNRERQTSRQPQSDRQDTQLRTARTQQCITSYIRNNTWIYTQTNQQNSETIQNQETINTDSNDNCHPESTTHMVPQDTILNTNAAQLTTQDNTSNVKQQLSIQATQTPEAQETETWEKSSTWGHKITTKASSTIKILLQNIGRIDLTNTGSIRLAALWDYTNKVQADICTITECNIDRKHAPVHLYPTEQTWHWWENSHWGITNNTQETNEAPLPTRRHGDSNPQKVITQGTMTWQWQSGFRMMVLGKTMQKTTGY